MLTGFVCFLCPGMFNALSGYAAIGPVSLDLKAKVREVWVLVARLIAKFNPMQMWHCIQHLRLLALLLEQFSIIVGGRSDRAEKHYLW